MSVTVANAWSVPAGLVAAYTFSEGTGTSVADASGSGRVGTLTGGATWAAAGRFGSALSFNGTNALVSIADAASLDFTTSLTIEAWVRPTTLTGWRTLLLKGAGANALAYALYAHDNAPRAAAYVNITSEQIALTPSALPLNTWTHVR